ncbi:hypothetical protein Pmar_PMAR013229, partial [Perkinsus marinus ATCC 50983]
CIEFTPLHEWQEDEVLYRRIMKIPFFAKFPKWKFVTVWRTTVVKEKIQRCR